MKGKSRSFFSRSRIPISLQAIIAGFLTAAIAANVWLLLLLNLGAWVATMAESLFLALFLWCAHGGGPPRWANVARVNALP